MSKIHVEGNNLKIKKSKIWNTTQGILSIMSDLKDGYVFDGGDMRVLINTCIDFLNNTIKPTKKGEEKLNEQRDNASE